MNASETKAYAGRNGELYKTAIQAQRSFDIAQIEELFGKFNSLRSLARDMVFSPITWAGVLDAVAKAQAKARAIDEANEAGKGAA